MITKYLNLKKHMILTTHLSMKRWKKMLSKEDCEIALENAVDTGIIKKDWKILNQLIEEHFVQKENTEEYKHFKLHSDSTLKI